MRRVLRCFAAAGLAAAIGATGLVGPARAVEPKAQVQAAAFGFDWVSLTIAVIGALSSGGGGGGDLDAAVRQIVAAVEQAKTDIINHTDAIAAADVQACVRSATIESTNIESFPPPVLILWAQNATSCATLASAYANTLTSPAAVDNIGQLVGPIYSIVLAARAKAGLANGTDLILQDEIRAYEAVVAKLLPACRDYSDPSGAPIVAFWAYYECVAYNGDRAVGKEFHVGARILEPRIDRPAVEAEATRNTSRPTAIDALARLRPLRPVM
jgi:hypothetical protein